MKNFVYTLLISLGCPPAVFARRSVRLQDFNTSALRPPAQNTMPFLRSFSVTEQRIYLSKADQVTRLTVTCAR